VPYPILCISDPGLLEASGHSVAALGALGSAYRDGSVEVYGHRAVNASAFRDFFGVGAQVHGHFNAYFYDAYDALKGLSELNEYIGVLARDYETLLQKLGRRGGRFVVLHHTMDWPHLTALALANEKVGQVGSGLRHLVFLLFNPGVSHDRRVTNPRRYFGYRAALSRLGRQSNIRFFAGGLEVQGAFLQMAPEHGPFPIHPCFYLDESPPVAPVKQHPERLTLSVATAKVVLFLGDAKAEKGFLELPSLVQRLAEQVDRHAELVVDFNLDARLASPEVRQAAEALEAHARHDKRLRLSSLYSSNSQLHQTLAHSDFLVLNYDPATYAERSSGLLRLAAKCDTPVVAIGRSWLTREGERLGVPLCIVESPDELVEKIMRDGALTFQRTAPDIGYRDQVFAPLGEFLRKAASDAVAAGDRKRVLFIDASVPAARRSGSGHAALSEIRLYQALGFAVEFVSLAEDDGQEQVQELEALGVMIHRDGLRALVRLGKHIDHVFITRFNVAEATLEHVRHHAPQARVILNVADLHFLREMRRAELEGDPLRATEADTIRDNELGVMSRADLVLTYSNVEKELIERELGESVKVRRCPWVERILPRPAAFEQRDGIAYLGGFAHAPNVDAVLWFVESVMPLLRAKAAGVRFYIYGADMPPAIAALESEDVSIMGAVNDVSQVYDRCRAFVAPLRYGAGLKAKVAGALARGVPCVLSPIAAEGFGDVPARIADTPEQWVTAIQELHENEDAWEAMSAAAVAYGAKNFAFEHGLERFKQILAGSNVASRGDPRAKLN